MAGGKHSSDEEFDWGVIPFKKILIIFLILIVVAGVTYGVYYGVNALKEKNKAEEVVATEEEEGMPKTINGYSVLGQLVIEKIEVQQYILDGAEDEALKNGISKLYGGEMNEIGNFCIAGHNYEGIFEKLNELEIEDRFYILDRNEQITEYKIVGIYEIEPEDLTCLLPNEEIVEVTLITCENEATTRLVVKAEKIENETEAPETTSEGDSVENTENT